MDTRTLPGWARAYVLQPYGDVAALEAFTAIVAAEQDEPAPPDA